MRDGAPDNVPTEDEDPVESEGALVIVAEPDAEADALEDDPDDCVADAEPELESVIDPSTLLRFCDADEEGDAEFEADPEPLEDMSLSEMNGTQGE